MAVRRKNKLNFTYDVVEEIILNCQFIFDISLNNFFKEFIYFIFESYDFSILVSKSKDLQEFVYIINGAKDVKYDFELELIVAGLLVLGSKKKDIYLFFEKLCNVGYVLNEVEDDLNLNDVKYV